MRFASSRNLKWPVTILLLLSVPDHVIGQDSFVGRRFMPRFGATFHVGDKEVPRSEVGLPIVVKRVEGKWLWSGRAWINKSDVIPLNAAIEYYTDYLRENGSDPEVLINRGLAWSEQNESRNAIKDFTDAIGLDSENATAFFQRGLVQHLRGELDAAIKDYTEAKLRSGSASCGRLVQPRARSKAANCVRSIWPTHPKVVQSKAREPWLQMNPEKPLGERVQAKSQAG